MVCSPACILTSSTSTSMSSGLARASWTSMELFEMDMHQLQQAAAMVMLSDINTNAQQQCSIKEMASKLATSSSSSVAVGERAARTTVEHACSHRRHERHERRDQRHLPSRAIIFIFIYILSIYLSIYLRKGPPLSPPSRVAALPARATRLHDEYCETHVRRLDDLGRIGPPSGIGPAW
jgi:hypothetical protein